MNQLCNYFGMLMRYCIKSLYRYFISNEYLHKVYIISLKVILYVGQGIKLFN